MMMVCFPKEEEEEEEEFFPFFFPFFELKKDHQAHTTAHTKETTPTKYIPSEVRTHVGA